MMEVMKCWSSFLCLVLCLAGCVVSEEPLEYTMDIEAQEKDNSLIIQTSRSAGNVLRTGGFRTLSEESEVGVDFDIELGEFVVLPEIEAHIWLGNVLYASSIMKGMHRPIRCRRKPIKVSSTYPGVEPLTISKPSYSSYNRFVKGEPFVSGGGHEEKFELSMEQFSSYNELKGVLGVDIDVANLLGLKDSLVNKVEPKVTRATGLYLRFSSVAYTNTLDYPEDGYIADLPRDLVDSAVYVQSIAYGRLGLLALETDLEVNQAKFLMEQVVRKWFRKKRERLTKEEYAFLERATFKFYQIGGVGTNPITSFLGAESLERQLMNFFTLSKVSSAVPIYYTLANVSDNALFRMSFKYRVNYDPLYVELGVEECLQPEGYSYVVSLNFYSDKNKTPTIASPHLPFEIDVVRMEYIQGEGGRAEEKKLIVYNTNQASKIPIAEGSTEMWYTLDGQRVPGRGVPLEDTWSARRYRERKLRLHESSAYYKLRLHPKYLILGSSSYHAFPKMRRVE